MLSAVAARKARLQSQGSSQTPPPPKSPQPSPPPPARQNAKPPSKRKLSSQTPKPTRQKRRKVSKEDKNMRYFQQKDLFKEQEDVIVVEDEDEAMSSESSEESDFERTAVPVVSRPRKRAWSPSAPMRDSSDEGEEGDTINQIDLDVTTPLQSQRPTVETVALLSTFRPVQDQNTFSIDSTELTSLGVSSSGNARVLSLHASDTLTLLGTYSLTVLRGSIDLSTVTLTPSIRCHRVFAPRSSPLPVIKCLPKYGQSQDIFTLPIRLQEQVKTSDAIILVQELRTGVEGLGRVCRTFENVFEPSRWQKNQSVADLGLQGVYYVAYEMQDIVPFGLPRSWERALSSVVDLITESEEIDFSRHVFLVKGAKKSGKSTFARTLLNRLSTKYQKVAFLECDLGQSEFTPGGMVALNVVSNPIFGPPFTHPSIPHQAHYIGSTSPRDSPSYYLEAINALIQTYNLDLQHAALIGSEETHPNDSRICDIIPLVVNMMGWTKGLGADLCKKIEEMLEPSHVFHFEAPAEESWTSYNNHHGGGPPADMLNTSNAAQVYTLEPVSPTSIFTRYSPADHRTLSILSYFHAEFPPTPWNSIGPLRISYATSWNTTVPLCAQPPFELSAQSALDRVLLTQAGSEDVMPSEIVRVLNGAVVGLVACESGALDLDANPFSESVGGTTGIPYSQGAPPPSSTVSNCHGLALVRSVVSSPSTVLLHLLTPLPSSVLCGIRPRVLVKGEMELPVWGMLDFRGEDIIAGVEKAKIPFLKWGKGEGMGGERRRVRRNLMRRGQM